MSKPFKVGDRITAFGLKGTVTTRNSHTIDVKYDDGSEDSFLLDGRLWNNHKKPSLKHLKIKKKPRLECYVNVYNDDSGTFCLSYSSREQAFKHSITGSKALEVGVRMVRAKDQKRDEK